MSCAKPKFFQCYIDNALVLDHLCDEQAGKLWKSLFYYAGNGLKPDISDPMVSMAFDFLAQQIDRDFQTYELKCNKNRENAKKRIKAQAVGSDRCKEEEKEEEKEEDKEEDKEKEKEDNTLCIVGDSPTQYLCEISDIVDYLNMVTGCHYRETTASTRRHIHARLKEGYSVDDFKKVIDNRFKEWGTDKKMHEYIRPQTLFGTKFESYLNCADKSIVPHVDKRNYDEEF